MAREDIINSVRSTRDKLKMLEGKAFAEDKGRYPIIKNQIDSYMDDLDYIENHNLGDDLAEELLSEINETADLDLETFVKEKALDTPAGELLAILQRAALDNEKELPEDVQNIEIPPVENIIGAAEATEEVPIEETPEVEEVANELDQVDTEAIVNSLDEEPKEEFAPIPEDLANEMINAANEAEANAPTEEETVEETPLVEDNVPEVEPIPVEDIAQPEEINETVEEAAPEVAPVVEEAAPEEVVTEAPVEEAPVAEPVQDIANVPTQDVNVAAIDDILNTLDAPAAEEAPVQETAAEPVAEEAPTQEVVAPVDTPPMEEAVAEPVATPVVEEVPTQEVIAPVDTPPMEEAVAQPVAAPVVEEVPVQEAVPAPEVVAPVVENVAPEEVIAAPEPAPAVAEAVPTVEVPGNAPDMTLDVPGMPPAPEFATPAPVDTAIPTPEAPAMPAAPEVTTVVPEVQSPIVEQAVEQVAQEVAQEVVAPAMPEVAPVMDATVATPEMVAPTAPVAEGPALTLNM